MWFDASKPFAGKIILRPETSEEEQALMAFRAHVASNQRGRKFEIIYKRRVVGPEQMTRVLNEVSKSGA